MSQGEGGGAPTKYRFEYVDLVYKYALLGLTNEQMAELFGVTITTFYNWQVKHRKFFEAIKNGREKADSEVVHTLRERAMGFDYEEEKAFFDKDASGQERIVKTKVTKRALPDPTAMIFWLKNRQPALWRDRVDHNHNHKGNVNINVSYEGEIKSLGDNDLTEED